MNMHETLKLLPLHALNWKKLKTSISNQRLAQALLCTGPASCRLDVFASFFMAAMLCTDSSDTKPCGNCPECQMVVQEQHPDIQRIRAEKKGGLIKIDQIRSLQAEIYQSPLCNAMKFIVIHGAEYMNTASANSLLKILEEPPSHACFLLLTDQIATVPATITSRCQLLRFQSEEKEHYLSELSETAPDYEAIIQGLLQLSRGEIHYATLAEQWKNWNLHDLLSILYRINAQMVLINSQKNHAQEISQSMVSLARLIKNRSIFVQLDKINILQKKIVQNFNMNSLLALENLLMEYQSNPA